jgi:hypothetical protein
LEWEAMAWALDASFKGRKKETEQGKVYASTKAHRLTKLFIWLNDVRESASGVEKIRETLWQLSAREISLSNLAAVKKLVNFQGCSGCHEGQFGQDKGGDTCSGD